MKIAVVGCAHGEIESIYSTIQEIEIKKNIKVDLLICCGDFQSARNEHDLCCMAIPQKFYHIRSFYKYYIGELVAPILTLFVGGNHEASNYLQELPYGGWVAPNIYYMGYANVVNIANIRIAGLSGLFNKHNYFKGRFESPPYNERTKRSVYYTRNLEIFRLKQVSNPIDIFISHEWPTNIVNYGSKKKLLRFKPYFRDDIESGELGSRPCEDLLKYLKPTYWFAAHLHCKFSAIVPHGENKFTKFLALDKCEYKKQFLQIMDIPHNNTLDLELKYDIEWLTILRLTNHLTSVKFTPNYLPGREDPERWNFQPTLDEKNETLTCIKENLRIPENFIQTAKPYQCTGSVTTQPSVEANLQTYLFCKTLKINDPMDLLLGIYKDFENKHPYFSSNLVSTSDVNSTSQVASTSEISSTSKDDTISDVNMTSEVVSTTDVNMTCEVVSTSDMVCTTESVSTTDDISISEVASSSEVASTSHTDNYDHIDKKIKLDVNECEDDQSE